MKLVTTLFIIILFITTPFFFNVANAQKFTINGYVKDAENGESLIGAVIYDNYSKTGVITNIFGFYSLTLPVDSVSLSISFVGYEKLRDVFFLNENKQINYELNTGSLLDEVVVVGQEAIEVLSQMSSITLPVAQIKEIPALMGEVDILKTIQLLPGIQSGGEGSSGVYVRGGGADQNLILIDGVPVYNISHLFGFFSVFNADAINNISVIKGGFPARYGGRLSSVIDLTMKEGYNKKIKGKLSIGLLSSKLLVEGPIKKEKSSFLVSFRRTYADLLVGPFLPDNTNLSYYFYDLNAKVNHQFSDKDRLYFSFYTGLDELDQKEGSIQETKDEFKFGVKWGNIISALRWNHLFSPQLFSNVAASYSRYNFNLFDEFTYLDEDIETGATRTVKENSNYASNIEDLSFKVDFDYLPVPSHSIKFGSSVVHHTFNPGALSYISSNAQQDTVLGTRKIQAVEFSAYVEDDISISQKIRVNAGVHTSGFNVSNKQFYSVQPRISGRVLVGNNTSIKASYAQMTQFIHLLSASTAGLPNDLWVPATDRVKPQNAWQVAIGASRTLGKIEITLESYYKKMNQVIEYSEGASFLNTKGNWEDQVSVGNGTSYGLELLIQKKTGRFTGWVGYTLSKTTRQFDDINFGNEYPYRYDRRHDISLVASYKIKENIILSGTWVYGTGNAVSLATSRFNYVSERKLVNIPYKTSADYYPSRNNFRMRDNHRLDLGISMSKQKKRGTRTWSMGFYNVYSRSNPFFLQVSGGKIKQYSLLPIVPYVNYSFEF